MKYESLHSHTTSSDGLLTYQQVIEVSSKNNIGTIAFTDHDTLIDEMTLGYLKSQDRVSWISGIEMSSGLPVDLGGGTTSSFHILGLFVDPFNLELLAHCKKSLEARIVRMEKIVSNLVNLGFEITSKDCLLASEGESVGRPHIVQAIKSHPKNLKVIKDIRLKMLKDSKTNEYLKHKYDVMMMQGEDQYPYTLFLSSDSYISDIYVDYQYILDMDSCVKLIRNAGGIASIAHYYTIKKLIDYALLENMLKNNRIDGCETVFGFRAYGTPLENNIKSDQNRLKCILEKLNKIETGGADAHSLNDYVNFGQNNWFSQPTIGMTEKIISSKIVHTQYSSFN